uniref:Ig-like domain-containing protein n=1 Tax=Hucho hucho TaxID=62062 RepID=A0A4W5J9L5_9TELE
MFFSKQHYVFCLCYTSKIFSTVLLVVFLGSWGIITVDQSPPSLTRHWQWYGGAPVYTWTGTQNYFYDGTQRYLCTPGRFSGSYTGYYYQLKVFEQPPHLFKSLWYMFGQTTKLIGKTAPQVSLFAPTGKDLTRTGGQTTLLCLINNFYPDQVTLSWTMDGKGVSGDQQDSQSVRIPDRTYSTSSTLTLPRSTWESGEMYVCQVQH